MASKSMVLLFLTTTAFAATLFDVCAWRDAEPVLYHTYGVDEWTPLFHLQPNGVDCEEDHVDKQMCASFCQIRTTFYYGRESPYFVDFCRPGNTCHLSEARDTIVDFKATTNGNFNWEALNTGISGGFRDNYGASQRLDKKHDPLPEGTCGYWTFIPYIHQACGTYSQAAIVSGNCDLPWQTKANACAEQLVEVSASGSSTFPYKVVRGIAILVLVDCDTLEPFPDDQQDPAYRQPGVKMPDSSRPAYREMLQTQAKGEVSTESVECSEAPDNATRAPDCINAMAKLRKVPWEEIGDDSSPAGSCSIKTERDPSWGDKFCFATHLGVAAAAQEIFDWCLASDGSSVKGSVSLGGNAGCYKVSLDKGFG